MREHSLKVVYVPISHLKEWEKNPRKNDQAAEKLVRLIEKFGFVNPIIATPDGVVRAGHTRLKAARKLGITEVPVIFVNFDSEEEAEAYSLSDNKSHEWSSWDYPTLEEVLADLSSEGFDLELTGFDSDEIDRILKNFNVDIEELLPEAEEGSATQPAGQSKRVVVCPNCGYIIRVGGRPDGNEPEGH